MILISSLKLAFIHSTESYPVRLAFCRRCLNGVLRFYATAEKLQATITWMCRSQAQELNNVNFSTATSGMFRYVIHNSKQKCSKENVVNLKLKKD